jgi:toxin-antitoxin system PIN domain toxin
VNVLVALAWPNHIHHRRAQAWFRQIRDAGWATCPMTETGFVRVSSNTRVIPDARPPSQAIALLREIRTLPGHVFWVDDVSPASSEPDLAVRVVGHRQVTDAHLVALAYRRGGCLATFDRGVPTLVEGILDGTVELIGS